MASFDENGKYIKTNWKAGDKITATKLNKIEESIEAVNDNDISRHVEVDARLDVLEAKDVAHDKELTNIKNAIADNKAAAELGDYDINSRMTFLENELNEGIDEVHNVANTVDGKIAQAKVNMQNQVNQGKADMAAQVNQGKADMEAMVAEVDAEVTELQNDVVQIQNDVSEIQNDIAEFDNHTHEEYLPLSGGVAAGEFVFPSMLIRNNTPEINADIIFNFDPTTQIPRLRVGGTHGNTFEIQGSGDTVNLRITQNKSMIETRHLCPIRSAAFRLGASEYRWNALYLTSNPDVSSDRSLKENIEYIDKAKSGVTYDDLYNFVKDDLGLATYNFINDNKLRMNFIAQDLLVNADGTDNKIGQMIVNPVAVPTEEEIEEGTPYPTLSYDMGMYISVLAGALKESINKIEQLEARIQELENK